MRRTLAMLAALLVMFASLAGCAAASNPNKTTLQHDQGGHDWEGGDRWTH